MIMTYNSRHVDDDDNGEDDDDEDDGVHGHYDKGVDI